jgi:DNA-binding NtrC family response regulator
MFACFFQLARAFIHIFDCIIGGSMASARLRADVWRSVFTHDMRRYGRGLYRQMGDIATLITGPSGSGKELVARAIGLSRFIEFDVEREQFAVDYVDSYCPLNLSALAPTLIESELFGHKKGAFSGAESAKEGWLEVCSSQGTVFLDEIGDVDSSIQVKLLRVLEERVFYRVGEVRPKRYFRGKFVTATNRDLTEEIRQGRFREDLYYRLCADMVMTPSLRGQLTEAPDDLLNLVRFVTGRMLSDNIEEADKLASDVVEWIEKNLGLDYAWPGNIRELEQCVRNILIRGTYRPLVRQETSSPLGAFAEDVMSGTLTSDQLLRRYYSLVYSQAGSYQAAASRLQVNWRTLRKKVDSGLAKSYRNG